MNCNICPRNCNAIRSGENKKYGFCGMPENPVIAKVSLHEWEEPCISGRNGSGTIFFSGCTLKCVFCQNYEISTKGYGREISVERLTEIFKELEDKNAENINLVNPTHFSKAIIEALNIYKPKIPVVYNCSGYEKVETLKKFEGLIDIYLTDLKYFDGNVSKKYSCAEDYFEVSEKAVKEMLRQQSENIFDENNMMKKGVIIRHLVLPGNLTQTEKILKWIKNSLPEGTLISLMSQYVPFGEAEKYKEINRKITRREYNKALDMLEELKLENGFVQELSSSSKNYIPDFNLSGVEKER